MLQERSDEVILLTSSKYIEQKEYWINTLSGDIASTEISLAGKKGLKRGKAAEKLDMVFPSPLCSQLMHLGNRNELAIYIILLAALKALVYHYSGNEDITVVSPVYQPMAPRNIMNDCVFIRDIIDGRISFKELLLEIKETVLNAYKNQDYPSEKIIEFLVNNSLITTQWFSNILCLLKNIHKNTQVRRLRPQLIFSLSCHESLINGQLFYDPEAYSEIFAKQVATHYVNLLDIAVHDVNIRISDICFLSKEEKKCLLFSFNSNKADFYMDKPIYRVIEEYAETNPHHTSAVYDGIELSYRELNERATRLAGFLRENGIQRDQSVGILLRRSLKMVVSILAVWKAGGSYIPIDPDYPLDRILYVLEDSQASILLTDMGVVKMHSFTHLQNLQLRLNKLTPYLTPPRPDITNIDGLPFPDRSLVNYEEYNKYIGQTMVKNGISIQATRGCPYKCAYCHRIWSKKHYVRSAENIFEEVQFYYNMGVRRFSFVDDIFNLNRKNSERFFQLLIKNNLDVHLFFPNGLRGDILKKEYIDLMVEAGTVNLALALETASPRIQKLISKHLNIEKFHENINYFIKKYPQVILEIFSMHGFPSETEEEAMMTLNFIKSLKWVHFPYVGILKIYSGIGLEKIALEHGISREAINRSQNYITGAELQDSLPFDKKFTMNYQTSVFNDYFLVKQRLLHVLPFQMKILTEDELIQKYDSYLPVEIENVTRLLEFLKISEDELAVKECLDEDSITIPRMNERLNAAFPVKEKETVEQALRVLLLDLSQFFSSDSVKMQYNVVEPPLGLMYLMTYLKRQFGNKITGKIAKSRIDFDNYKKFKELLEEFKPHVIGVRTLTYYKDFFHKTIALIKQWGIDTPIIAGGPYASSGNTSLLQDSHIDVVVLGEGELTFAELIGKIMANDKKLPGEEVLKEIAGLAFIPGRREAKSKNRFSTKIVLVDQLENVTSGKNLKPVNQRNDLAYIIYTSGSTGKPKGAMVEHIGMMNHLQAKVNDLHLTPKSIVAQNVSHMFDISVWQFFAPLAVGGKTVIYPNQLILEPGDFITMLLRHQVTALEVVPSYLSLILDLLEERVNEASFGLKYLLVTGEEIKPFLVKKWFQLYPHIKIVNAYGPTEASDDITHYIMAKAPHQERVPIGKPVQNMNIYILDGNMNLCPIGVKGEICVSGIGVGRGYLNEKERTGKVFMKVPFGKLQNGQTRLYKTGDWGCWLPDGTIDFLGRKDYQVKIRGFRIEPQEIENRLIHHAQVMEAVVMDRMDDGGNKYLCAYVVSPVKLDIPEIKEYLARDLPGYMIPEHFVQLDRIPLTPNGKINRSALPSPEFPDISTRTMKYIKGDMMRLDPGKKSAKTAKLPDFSEDEQEKFFKTMKTALEQEKLSLEIYSRQAGRKYYPLSYPQKMIYYSEKQYPGTSSENVTFTVRYPRQLDRDLLEKTINIVLRENEGLRLRILEIEQEAEFLVTQYVGDSKEYKMDYFDFSGEASESILAKWVDEKTKNPFDLIDRDIFFFAYIKYSDTESGYYINMHHIISDQWTCLLLFVRIDQVYRELESAQAVDESLQPSYLQYIHDEIDYHNSIQSKRDREFWHKNLLPLPRQVDLSSRKGNPKSINANACVLAIPDALRTKIYDYCKNQDTSLYKIMLSALSIYISRIARVDDFVIGCLNHNRGKDIYKKMVGAFISFVPLRIKVKNNSTFRDFVRETGKELNHMIKNHQKFPFGVLVNELREKTGADLSHFHNINLIGHADLKEREFKIERIFPGYEVTHLSIHINRSNRDIYGTLEIEWVYQVERFTETDVKQIHWYLVNILEDALTNPGKKLSGIELLSPTEKERIFYELDEENITYLRDKIPIESFDRTRVYVLSEKGMVQPPGVPGELCLVADQKGAMYRSGELVRGFPDGTIELLGNIERQEWIKGNWVGLDVIEGKLKEHHDVREAAVVKRSVDSLCAFLVSGKKLVETQLKEYLGGKLPAQMIPGEWVQLERMPLRASGEIDRKMLEEIEIAAVKPEYRSARGEVEEKLTQIWSDILGIETNKISIDKNFFQLGGHSIKAIKLVSLIHKELDVKIPLVEIFKLSTIQHLAEHIKGRTKDRKTEDQYASVEAVEKREHYDVSHAQRRLWILDRFEPGMMAYNVPGACIFKGKLDRQTLDRVFETLVKRHESLRTTFIEIREEPRQKIHDFESSGIKIEYVDCREEENSYQKARTFAREDAECPFDLEKGPLLRTRLLHVDEDNYLFLFTMHHIISDGWSMDVLVREFLTLYNAFREGKKNSLSSLRIQYKDYSAWHDRQLSRENLEKHQAYWFTRFNGEIPVLKLPTDYPRPPVKTYNGNSINFELNREINQGLNTLSQVQGTSLFMTLVALFNLLFYCYTGQEDIIIGVPVAGREHNDLENQIGFYINTLPLRTIFSGDDNFQRLLSRVKETTLEVYQHQLYPFNLLMGELNLTPDASRSPLFDVVIQVLNFEAGPEHQVEMQGISIESHRIEVPVSQYDLAFHFFDYSRETGIINATLFYNTDLFKHETMDRMVNRFRGLIKDILKNTSINISDLSFDRYSGVPSIKSIPRRR